MGSSSRLAGNSPKISPAQKLILYALGQFYNSLNQPLTEKPVRVRTSKIAFIELLLQSRLVSKQERAVYKNLEMLEKGKLIAYKSRMISFTEKGLKQFSRVQKQIKPFMEAERSFQDIKNMKSTRKLQTVMESLIV